MAEDLETSFSTTTSGSPVINSLKEIKSQLKWHEGSLPGMDELSPRVGHSLVPFKNGKMLMIGGGQNDGAVAEIWEINLNATVSQEQVIKYPEIEGFKARYEFLCVKEQEDNDEKTKIWIFGGASSNTTMNDIGYISEKSWIESISSVSSDGTPSPRTQGGNTTRVEVQGKSYLGVFAGGLAGEKAVEDGKLYVYDIEGQCWIDIRIKSDTPPITQGHGMVGIGSKVFVHGGINGTTLHDGLYMIDLEKTLEPPYDAASWILVEDSQKKPTARAAHGMTRSSESSPKSIYIFGGLGQTGGLNDLWRFNLESMTWSELSASSKEITNVDFESESYSYPSPRFDFAMTSIRTEDEVSGVADYLVIHGGMNTLGELFNDIWVMRID